MYWTLRASAYLIAGMHPKTLDQLASLLTWIGFDVLRIRRHITITNLEIAFGNSISKSRRLEIARNSFRNLILTAFEFMYGSYHDVVDNVEFEAAARLRKILTEDGKGFIILCMHMGNWESMGATISRLVTPAHVIVKPVGGEGVDRFVTEVRKKIGFWAIKRTEKGNHVRSVLTALKRSEIVGFVMDQYRPGEPKFPFFGKPARTNTGLAVIARKTKSRIIPAYCVRESFGCHKIYFLDAFFMTITEDVDQDIQIATTLFNEKLADIIRRNPDQYLWMHNRWK